MLSSLNIWLESNCFQLVYVALNVAGADQRQDDLFLTESLFAIGRSALKGLKVQICLQFQLLQLALMLNVRALRMSTLSIVHILHRLWKTCLRGD